MRSAGTNGIISAIPPPTPAAPVFVEGRVAPTANQVPGFNTTKGIYDPSTGGAGGAGSISVIEYQLQNYITWDPPNADPGGAFIVPDTANTANTSIAILDGTPHTFDGATLCKVEFVTAIEQKGNGQQTIILFYDGATQLGRMVDFYTSAISTTNPLLVGFYGVYIFTPSAGSHTFHLKAYKDVTGLNNSLIYGGAGGADGTVPAVYIVTTFSVAP